ncbi:MAG: NAD(P)H-hydrate dehydratase [Bacteroidota bacterium]
MKILSVNQIREADKYTIECEPITSIDLMERAAVACANWIVEHYDTNITFTILCGLGNNGGDGLAIARLLAEKNYRIKIVIIRYSETTSENFTINLKRISNFENVSIKEINKSVDIALLGIEGAGNNPVFIDAVLGSGINRPVDGLIAEVISLVNQFHIHRVISIDVPSGLFVDSLNDQNDVIIRADNTLSFQYPKLSFMFPEIAEYIGVFSVLDIGLNSSFTNQTQTKNYFITKTAVRSFLKPRSKIAHKGNFGHALIVAGAYGKMGAAVLAAKACMKTGAGLVTSYIPKCGYEIMQTALPEAMTAVDSEMNFISDNIRLEKYNAIAIGPGIGLEKQTQNVVKLLIQNSPVPIVFDADAINCIAENKTWLSFVPPGSIFTPHPKEFERLTGKAKNSEERLSMQKEFSLKYNIYIVLKGARTSISCPDGTVYFNSTGNPGMATGGSGDALTGIITSLIAQGYSSEQSCILGVYLHGLAGDFAAHNLSEESMIASDIIDHLSDAFKFIKE